MKIEHLFKFAEKITGTIWYNPGVLLTFYAFFTHRLILCGAPWITPLEVMLLPPVYPSIREHESWFNDTPLASESATLS